MLTTLDLKLYRTNYNLRTNEYYFFFSQITSPMLIFNNIVYLYLMTRLIVCE